jgi:putative nucleotidyltransferase with HDIG domain
MGNFISAAVRHLGLTYKILAMLLTSVAIVAIFPHTRYGAHYDYKVGGIWRDSDLVAPYDFAVTKSKGEMANEEQKERAQATLFYHRDDGANSTALKKLEERRGSLSAEALHRLKDSITLIYRKGYLEWDEPLSAEREIVVLDGKTGNEGHSYKVGDFVTRDDLEPGFLRDSILVPSLLLDETQTQLELQSRLSQLSNTSELVMAGDLIIAKGEEVTEEKGRRIAALEIENDRRFTDGYNLWGQMAGQVLLAMIAFVALYMFLKNTRHSILEDNRKVTFVLVLVLLMSAFEAMMAWESPEWILIVPLCIVPILMRVFFDMRVALYIHLTTVIILANLVPNSFEFIFYQLVTGMMSIIAVRSLERRSQFFVLAMVIFGSYSFIYTAGVLSQETNLSSLEGTKYLVFFLNALLTLLAYPLIYLFEKFFGMTTALSLLELSSTNNKALRELSRRAPGTFQHSMQVANLTEDLVSEIGGNVLLAKVGALYHDIGKIRNPLYFTENQTGDFNPHDELDYTESARMITAHVTDGLEEARRYHLPPEVQDFIRTHHGTTMTGYFYAKEKERHPEGFDESLFRYPGPRPYSRETAVVMIVDTVEAACRSLKTHTKEATDEMIDRLIDGKIASGQLENCPLSYGDVAKIRRFLKTKMMSIYHVRVEYPTVKNEK